ncbi:MAG: hypothetical protein A3I77_03940 [Gammaproteobacteria bacterium RIFCSPLOWO2_02_FULL_42_14]|nr:MAG: hypothetical protein A3B71_05245 [Gammaproteobacteria bacterium RIFCSPHIGHO2_02_FULL_42_43]OGT27518.1 MAG: hypothetical protein A2624_03695 [Gammaproteobacteria bacterium RIFCSPHIGHO2_01_FULL_42_8]OGT51402.1 MAG: hypothetical protein A3E54_05010 [Gammaproteobacteria bacterium RIFCSPHIGHO2_12_FULL_41_25]OGT62104.1 MAG: hypothetical protein A3I77_03940 [Gammaproteobacteria bacterium RIFCSPLOWO2_02_FULL_42_14]OGT85776.1 MAG: hypothetical protein A3G86_03635 [Gammaproteobacteria bacterium R
MLFNYWVDPGNQFSHGAEVEQKMSKALLKNQSMIVQANYNERLLQKIMLEKLPVAPDIFVLGSSHIMPLSHTVFNRPRFFNASVSSANLQDDIALYYLLQKKGYQPKILIICLDPWIVSKSSPETLWKTEYIKEFNEGKNLILGRRFSFDYYIRLSGFFEKYSQLLSSEYLMASFNKLTLSLKQKENLGINLNVRVLSNTVDICPNCFVRQPDGARLPTPSEELTTPAEANTYVVNHVDGWKNFWSQSRLDPKSTQLFDSFIKYLVQHHVRVILYFPPLAPLEYQQLVKKNKNYQMVFVAQQYFNDIAKKYQLKIIGSYDPGRVKLSTKYFSDNWHLKTEGLNKLFLNKSLQV